MKKFGLLDAIVGVVLVVLFFVTPGLPDELIIGFLYSVLRERL